MKGLYWSDETMGECTAIYRWRKPLMAGIAPAIFRHFRRPWRSNEASGKTPFMAFAAQRIPERHGRRFAVIGVFGNTLGCVCTVAILRERVYKLLRNQAPSRRAPASDRLATKQ